MLLSVDLHRRWRKYPPTGLHYYAAWWNNNHPFKSLQPIHVTTNSIMMHTGMIDPSLVLMPRLLPPRSTRNLGELRDDDEERCIATFDVAQSGPKKVIHFFESPAYMSKMYHIIVLVQRGFQTHSVSMEEVIVMVRRAGFREVVISASLIDPSRQYLHRNSIFVLDILV